MAGSEGPDDTHVLTALESWIDRQPTNVIFGASLGSIFLFGVVDFLTGPEIAFSIFYLIPLAVVAWKIGARSAVAAAVVAAATWLGADTAAGSETHIAIALWNTTTRLGVFLLVVALLRTLRDAISAQQQLARTDSLTGVLNGRAFTQEAERALTTAQAERHPISMAYVDIDDFKSVNDVLGHSGGDDVLRAIATSLDSTTRQSDLVGRLGGDEFGILLPGADSDATKKVMQSLVARVAASLTGIRVPVSFSAGAVTFLVPPFSIDDMISAADGLMYETKRAGKTGFRHLTIGAETPTAVPDRGLRRG